MRRDDRRDLDDPRFTSLYRDAYRQVFASVLLATKDRQLAEESTQEAFLSFLTGNNGWLALPREQQVRLLRTIALRRSIDETRRAARFRQAIRRLAKTDDSSFTQLEAGVMTRDIIVRVVTDIPTQRERAVAIEAWINDKTAEQIAKDLDIPASTVRGILQRLRERFRDATVEVETEPERHSEGAV